MTLTRATNNFGSDGSGSVKITGANVSITDANLIDLGVSTVSGTYAVNAVTGNIVNSGVLTVSQASSFTTAASDGVITLDQANALTGAVTLNTNSSSTSAHATPVSYTHLMLPTIYSV